MYSNNAEVEHYNYAFLDKTEEVIYVGMTKNRKTRFRAHKHNKPWWDEVERIVWNTLPNREAALEREQELISLYKPKYNLLERQAETSQFKHGEAWFKSNGWMLYDGYWYKKGYQPIFRFSDQAREINQIARRKTRRRRRFDYWGQSKYLD